MEEERATVLRFYESNNFSGYECPLLEHGDTNENILKLLGMMDYVKSLLLKRLDKGFEG